MSTVIENFNNIKGLTKTIVNGKEQLNFTAEGLQANKKNIYYINQPTKKGGFEKLFVIIPENMKDHSPAIAKKAIKDFHLSLC